MGKAKDKTSRTTFPPSRASRPRIVPGCIFLLLGILVLISVVSYSPQQNPIFTTNTSKDNLVGAFGVQLAYYSLKLAGAAGWMIWIFLFWLAYMFFQGHASRLNLWRYLSAAGSLISITILLTLTETQFAREGETLGNYSSNYFPHGIGGQVGELFYRGFLHEKTGPAGTGVIVGFILLICLWTMTRDNVAANLLGSPGAFAAWWQERKAAAAKRKEEEAQRQLAEAKANAALSAKAKAPPPGMKKTDGEPKPLGPVRKPIIEEPEPPMEGMEDMPLVLPSSGAKTKTPAPFPLNKGKSRSPIADTPTPADPVVEEAPEGVIETPEPAPAASPDTPAAPVGTQLKIVLSEEIKKASKPVQEKKGDHVLPPLELLQSAPPPQDTSAEDAHEVTAEAIVRTLGEFGVKVTMGEVHIGPVITRYDVYPAAGVRVEKIANLDKNLALSLKALSVRILAPVPGRGCVGIEVPNKKPQPVCLRDIIESEYWQNFSGEIPICLGKEVSGKPMIADLARMPHCLIAGSTGAGKTVCINAIITSLLYRFSPDELRFVMVDPKIVEMQAYNSLPHMLIPVVTEPKKVPGALKYLLTEMERRYQMFASVGVRNIAGFNAKMAKKKDADAEAKVKESDLAMTPEERAAMSAIEVPRDTDIELPEKLHYIVVIIDELADLMMVAPADVETGIARLAQLARAAGIHLIIATQRPSVNVITGIIKANLPSRIAFKVAAKVDSRTILDTMGADQLIGRGDMLFLPPGSSDLLRAQGCYVADEEINAIIKHQKDHNGEPTFDEIFARSVEESTLEEAGEEGADGEEDDDLGADTQLTNQALDVLRSTKRASTSMIQRKLRIGYNRAARIMEILEERGIVGPDNGSQPREILKDLEGLKF